MVVSSTVQECRAKALEFDERARIARLPEIKLLYEELARQRRSMAETWEWLITEQSPARIEDAWWRRGFDLAGAV